MNVKHIKIQIMSLTVILCFLPSMSLAGAQWTSLTGMPTPRVALSTSVVDGKIYTIGGRTNPMQGKSRVSTVEVYDPAMGQWTTKANMPTGRFGLATSVVNRKIYAIGGFPGGPPTRIVEEYDPTTNTWTRKADLPTGRATLATGVVDGKIYVIGGGDSSVDVYDPTADTWTPVTELPTPRSPCVSVVDGKIYAIGGLGAGPSYPALSVVEQYDPATDTWIRKADMPTPRHSFTTTVIDGRIYAIGGRSSDGVENPSLSPVLDVEVYDPTNDTWVKGPPMTGTRNQASACAVDGILYVFGGWRVFSVNAFSTVEALDLNPIVDFNFDGAVDLDDLLILIESWGPVRNSSLDIGPMPWGDGVIDSRDLLVLAEHMVEYDDLVDNLQLNSAIQLFAKPDKPGGNHGASGPDYMASLSGGSWDQVTAKQIWGVDITASDKGQVSAKTATLNPNTSFGIGAVAIFSDGQVTGARPVVGGYEVAGLIIFAKKNEEDEVIGLELLFITPSTDNKHQIRASVGVLETGVHTGGDGVTLTPVGPFDVRLDEYMHGQRVEGPVVDTGYSMGAVYYYDVQAP